MGARSEERTSKAGVSGSKSAVPHPTRVKMGVVSASQNNVKRKKGPRTTGDDASLPRSKHYQRAMVVQERAVEALLFMPPTSPVHRLFGSATGTGVNLCDAGRMVVIWMRVTPPSGMGVAIASARQSPMNASRCEAVPCTAFCMFLQRWRILGFGLSSEKSPAPGCPMFAAACPRRTGDTSLAATMTWSVSQRL